MIVASFDARNVTAIFDAVEYKTLFLLLQETTAAQVNNVSARLKSSGFEISPTEAAAIVKSVLALNKSLLEAIAVSKDEPDEPEDASKPFMVQ